MPVYSKRCTYFLCIQEKTGVPCAAGRLPWDQRKYAGAHGGRLTGLVIFSGPKVNGLFLCRISFFASAKRGRTEFESISNKKRNQEIKNPSPTERPIQSSARNRAPAAYARTTRSERKARTYARPARDRLPLRLNQSTAPREAGRDGHVRSWSRRRRKESAQRSHSFLRGGDEAARARGGERIG